MALDKTTPPPEQQAAPDYHAYPTPGKLEIRATKPMATARDLSLACSPGVADACMEIARDPSLVTRYTARRNLVAVVSNGSAVLIYAKTDAASAARDLFKAVAEGMRSGRS
jgi:malate dehydrogenase (oxaloacetate-decarboxylating)(NADP+)